MPGSAPGTADVVVHPGRPTRHLRRRHDRAGGGPGPGGRPRLRVRGARDLRAVPGRGRRASRRPGRPRPAQCPVDHGARLHGPSAVPRWAPAGVCGADPRRRGDRRAGVQPGAPPGGPQGRGSAGGAGRPGACPALRRGGRADDGGRDRRPATAPRGTREGVAAHRAGGRPLRADRPAAGTRTRQARCDGGGPVGSGGGGGLAGAARPGVRRGVRRRLHHARRPPVRPLLR